MAHGGPRKGAGRKKGSGAGEKRPQVRKTATRVEAAIEAIKTAEVTPLAVLMECMTHSYKQWTESARTDDDAKKAAATFAEKAAAYVHPKLAATELSGNKDKPVLTVHEVRYTVIDVDPRPEDSPEATASH